MSLDNLIQKFNDKSAVVGVIGLGYVGLPVACVFARAGFQVIGLDIKQNRVAAINAGQSPIEGKEPGLADLLAEVVSAKRLQATTNYHRLAEADAILVAVDTPVDRNNQPQYIALRAAMSDLGQVITPGTLIVIESTVAPGTVEKVALPILEEESGLSAHQDFFLGTCPERVMPGKLLANLQDMDRACGGGTPKTAVAMTALYRNIVDAELDATEIITAELVKTAENAYRDVQIAFANEVAKICEANNADVWKVRQLVNKSPSRNMHLPGAGVGGHCIPKDPWLLAYSARNQVDLRLIPAARAVNESMPEHIADMTAAALTKAGLVVSQARVGVLGYAYLENSDDTRHSPTASMVAYLHASVSEITIHDPWVRQYQGDIYQAAENKHALILMVKHDAYRNLDFKRLKEIMRVPLLIDGRGFFDPAKVQAAGFIYWGVGRGQPID